jgi:malonyl-CoA O-methyltransferase
MAERLALMRLQPLTILDAGCGTGEALGELRTRYPEAALIALDQAAAMLAAARRRASAARPPPALARLLLGARAAPATLPLLVRADATRLPIAADSVDLVWSNLMLQWVDDPAPAFAEFLRAMRVGGLLLFTTLGPDTLNELRSAFAGIDRFTHVSRFLDMHDIGDMLVAAGFADPVMDAERLTLTYADSSAMLRELKAVGGHNATLGRPRGLMGRGRWHRVLEALERSRRDGRLPATYEVIYGHAWKPEPRLAADGRAIVRFVRPDER